MIEHVGQATVAELAPLQAVLREVQEHQDCRASEEDDNHGVCMEGYMLHSNSGPRFHHVFLAFRILMSRESLLYIHYCYLVLDLRIWCPHPSSCLGFLLTLLSPWR